MKLFSALAMAGCLLVVNAQSDPCGEAHKTQSSCDADTTTGGGCTWCKCAALPSACWTKANAAKLPAGVYQCDSDLDVEKPVVEDKPVEIVEIDETCDGTGFKCNATFGNITAIHGLTFTTASGTFKANETATLNFSAHLSGDIDLTAGTVHYKIWESGVPHFILNGNLDYYHCGPPPAGCDKTKPLALFIDQPTNLTSTCHVTLPVTLPTPIGAGIYTMDIYGEDENHEPYDFIVNLAYAY